MRSVWVFVVAMLWAGCGDGASSSCDGPGCTPVSQGPGVDGGAAAGSCATYLSCLLLVSPQSYAAAIQLYGKDSACWATSTQTAGCNQACAASFAQIAARCECAGETCSACTDISGSYFLQQLKSSQCQTPQAQPTYFDQIAIQIVGDQTVVKMSWNGGSNTVLMTGPHVCTGPFTVTQEPVGDPQFGCAMKYVANIVPSADGRTLSGTLTETRTCYGESPFTCSSIATLSR